MSGMEIMRESDGFLESVFFVEETTDSGPSLDHSTQSILQSDICPQELDKMTDVVESICTFSFDYLLNFRALTISHHLYSAKSNNIDILPVFITCDPARDDIKAVKTYVRGESAIRKASLHAH